MSPLAPVRDCIHMLTHGWPRHDALTTDPDRSNARSFLTRVVLVFPFSMGLLLVIGATAITVNALYFQLRSRPTPTFMLEGPLEASIERTDSVVAMMPQPRPVNLHGIKPETLNLRSRFEIILDMQRELERRGFYDGPLDGVNSPKTDAAIQNFLTAAGLKATVGPSDDLLLAIMRTPVKTRSQWAPVTGGRLGRDDAIGDLIVALSRKD